MRTIYVDSECKCHITDDGTMTAVETVHFEGKCDSYIEGNRLVPPGRTWTREDGVVFAEGMIAPWKPHAELEAAQAQYEAMLAEMDAAYTEGVESA